MRWILLFYFLPLLSFAQIDSTTTRLDSVAITAYRFKDEPIRAPYSFSLLRFGESGLNNSISKQQLNLQEYLSTVPGLFTLNAQNYAQDLRISIRGFGARSAFGIRGIKLIVDGIPETTPDGQGQIDNLNLGIIEQVQVLRGPAGMIYGNAAGGVIDITTTETIDSSYIMPSVTVGSYGMQQQQIVAGLKHDRSVTFMIASRITTDGYRDDSGFESYNFNVKHKLRLNKHQLNVVLNYADSPYAQDAGGLTLEEIGSNRRQARDRNSMFNTQEQVAQLKAGVSHQYRFKNWHWNNYAFYSYRDFQARLPFVDGGAVALQRNYAGIGSTLTAQYRIKDWTSTTQVGLDYGYQNDLRNRFNNDAGVIGAQRLRQNELFESVGIFISQRLSYKRWNFLSGLRYDLNDLKVKDRFLTDGDASAQRTLDAVSSSLGINYQWNDEKSLFLNFSTSFETPALTELSANPMNTGGFNAALQPQKAHNYELGYRVNQHKSSINVALFYIQTRDDLVPFELADFPDRTFYRNAGTTNRYGVEVGYRRQLTKLWAIAGSYTLSDFSYGTYSNSDISYDGNELPAIPNHTASAVLSYSTNLLNTELNASYRGSMFTNDVNSVEEDEVVVLNLSGSYEIGYKDTALIPFAGINNLLNQDYNDNIRINAFAGRYFEPAPGINVYAGVRLRL